MSAISYDLIKKRSVIHESKEQSGNCSAIDYDHSHDLNLFTGLMGGVGLLP